MRGRVSDRTYYEAAASASPSASPAAAASASVAFLASRFSFTLPLSSLSQFTRPFLFV